MTKVDLSKLENLLREQQAWPGRYLFKFIVPKAQLERVLVLFKQNPVSERLSKNGKYISISCQFQANSPEEIIAIYRQASEIEGIISL